MSPTLSIVWFRQDLRLRDNPALTAAAGHGRILPVYILDDANPGEWRPGAASRWWLQQSLAALDASLDGKLWLLTGDPLELLPQLAARHGATHVFWNRCYEPWHVRRDRQLKQVLTHDGLTVTSSNGSLIWEPWTSLKDDGTPYRVFTPFYRNARGNCAAPGEPLQKPRNLALADCPQGADKLARLDLMPGIRWYDGLATNWTPGEDGAHNKLRYFLEHGLADYKDGRDFPARRAVSRLSPHLHFGEVSPTQAWQAAARRGAQDGREQATEHFQRELAWREFSYSLLYHFPQLTNRNMNERFDAFPWTREKKLLQAWQRGETGLPLVDAGMRELWETGYMHNRVRMVVGSFLVKNLLHHWLDGARWFWDTLVDADLANNTASWQWVAGCGADAAPYFRIFNPVTQSQRFDPDGDYIRRFVPELKDLPARYIHEPSKVPAGVLSEAGVVLGKNYPKPVVSLSQTRERALEAYQRIKG
ncbi:MAG: deoxyribodipyrimidine photo-lyase [Pseudohongiellaceae bacterium]